MVPAMASGHEQRHQGRPADVKDPATWDDNAAETLAEPGRRSSAAWGLTLDAKADYPYLLAVNQRRRASSRSTPWIPPPASTPRRYMAMVCSGGHTTPPPGTTPTPVGLQLAAADGPELRPVRDPHL